MFHSNLDSHPLTLVTIHVFPAMFGLYNNHATSPTSNLILGFWLLDPPMSQYCQSHGSQQPCGGMNRDIRRGRGQVGPRSHSPNDLGPEPSPWVAEELRLELVRDWPKAAVGHQPTQKCDECRIQRFVSYRWEFPSSKFLMFLLFLGVACVSTAELVLPRDLSFQTSCLIACFFAPEPFKATTEWRFGDHSSTVPSIPGILNHYDAIWFPQTWFTCRSLVVEKCSVGACNVPLFQLRLLIWTTFLGNSIMQNIRHHGDFRTYRTSNVTHRGPTRHRSRRQIRLKIVHTCGRAMQDWTGLLPPVQYVFALQMVNSTHESALELRQEPWRWGTTD